MKKKIAALIILLIISISIISYSSYSFYVVVKNNNRSTASATTNTFVLQYIDGTTNIPSPILPGSVITKIFSVKNNSDKALPYKIKVLNITNTFTRTQDLTYSLKNSSTNTVVGSGTFPTSEQNITTSLSIPAKATHSFILTVTYANLVENQNADMNKNLYFKVNVAS